jgi:glycosyltransferase involved in cell wall biosynthesis
VATDCQYNIDHLRRIVGPDGAERIHEIVLGVDGERFRRRRPAPGGRRTLAVGRLVEKKGFSYLVEATALLRERGQEPERVTIVGEGPLRGALTEHARDLGVDDLVQFVGAREPAEVRELLEDTDLFTLPCVVAANGDRDSMPVVVKEALAMEIPVVVTDEVGLPEIVRDGWGRLVPPRDAAALADALEELLALDASERAAMGRAGRAFVLEQANLERETEKLIGLIDAVRERRPAQSTSTR